MHGFPFSFVHFCFSTALLGFLFLPFCLTVSASQWLSQYRFSSHFHASPFFPAWFLIHSFLVLLLGSLFVSFHPSLLRSHSRSTSACLLLSLSAFPLIIDFLSSVSSSVLTTWLSVSSFPFFPVLPHSGFPSVRLCFRSSLSPFFSTWSLMSIFQVSVLGFLFVSFRSSLFRSHSRSTGDSLDCSLGTSTWLWFPFVHLSF